MGVSGYPIPDTSCVLQGAIPLLVSGVIEVCPALVVMRSKYLEYGVDH